MTFDFFNPSHLAFGTKLTRAFNQLNNLCIDAEDNVQDLFRIYDIYKQYVNRNYPCPMPTRGDAPCRTNELFDLINDENTIKSFYITEEGKFHCALNIFRRTANRFTRAEGETDLKEGYAFCKSSISNSQPEREIQFTDTYTQGEGNFLFSFRIDSDNNINISENAYSYFLPSNFDHITGMTYEDEIHPDYTAKDYEAVLLIGWSSMDNNRPYGDVNSKLEVYLNGQEIEKVSGWLCRQFMVVYLKPEDKLTGSWSTGFRIKYTKNSVPIPAPAGIEVVQILNSTAVNPTDFQTGWSDFEDTGVTNHLYVYRSASTTIAYKSIGVRAKIVFSRKVDKATNLVLTNLNNTRKKTINIYYYSEGSVLSTSSHSSDDSTIIRQLPTSCDSIIVGLINDSGEAVLSLSATIEGDISLEAGRE